MQRVKKSEIVPHSLLLKKERFFKSCGDNDIWDFYQNNEDEFTYRTSEVKRLLLASSENRCAICSRVIYDFNNIGKNNIPNIFTIEHMVPKSRNPKLIFEWANMIPCCVNCNNSRDDKEYDEKLYINPCSDCDFESFICFSYSGNIYCSNPIFADKVDYMVRLYNLNSNSKRNSIKSERRRYYKLLIDENYQKIVKLNKEFGLSDNIIIFKDMYLFNERNTRHE